MKPEGRVAGQRAVSGAAPGGTGAVAGAENVLVRGLGAPAGPSECGTARYLVVAPSNGRPSRS